MTSEFGRISIREFSLFSPSSWVPTAFYNCGPGYTDGIRNPNATGREAENARVHFFENSDGKSVPSKLDEMCRSHDAESGYAMGKPNEAELLFKADSKFVSGLVTNFSSFEPVEKAYGTLAIFSFAAKMAFYDAPKTALEGVSNQIAAWGKQLGADARNQTLAELTQSDGTVYSCLQDSEGNFVFSCAREDEVQSVTLDEMMRATGAIQQLKDDFGDVYEETQLIINPYNHLTEVTHRSDGDVDAEGVIVGKPTLERLEKFFDLADIAYQPNNFDVQPNFSDSTFGVEDENSTQASALLNHLNVHLSGSSEDELDRWFADAEAIRLQAYQWNAVDKTLQNLWLNGNDTTLAAYDLQSVMASNNAEWDTQTGTWDYLDLPPTFEVEQYIPQFSIESINDFEYSLSDFDLGLENSPYGNVSFADYGYSVWWGDGGSSSDNWSNSYIDPLVLKLGGGAVHTTNLQGSTVMFDMAANGTKVRTGWITPDHAFLVRDRNRNGIIDDSSEMFSERTSATAATGFGALAQFDSNRDGWLDYRDRLYKELRLWTDINVDGITQKGELRSLGEFGITYLAVKNPVAKNVYDNGNLILNFNHYGISNRRGYGTGQIAEVLFNFGDTQAATSIYLSDQATAVRTADGRTIQLLSDKSSQTINASMSGINLLVGGKGDVLNAGNSRQTLLIGTGGTTMNGNAGSTHFVVNGSGNTVNTGTGDSFIEVNGDANTINASKGDVHLDVDGNRNRITIGSNDFVDLGGSGNTVSAAGNGKDNQILISGQKQTVSLSNSDIALQENASATVNGRNNDITLAGHSTLSGSASGGSLMVWGEDNIATVSNALVGLTEGAELQLTGRNDRVVLAGENELVVKGSAAGMSVNVFGEDNQVTMTGGSIMMAEGAELDLAGRSNAITMLGDNELHASDRGQRVEVYGDDNQAWVNGSTVTEHGTADVDLSGTGNSLRATSSRPDQVQREALAYDRHQTTIEHLFEEFKAALNVSVDQYWRDLPAPKPEPWLIEAQAAMDAASNTGGVFSDYHLPAPSPWLSGSSGSFGSAVSAGNFESLNLSARATDPLNYRPLIATPGPVSPSGSSGLFS